MKFYYDNDIIDITPDLSWPNCVLRNRYQITANTRAGMVEGMRGCQGSLAHQKQLYWRGGLQFDNSNLVGDIMCVIWEHESIIADMDSRLILVSASEIDVTPYLPESAEHVFLGLLDHVV